MNCDFLVKPLPKNPKADPWDSQRYAIYSLEGVLGNKLASHYPRVYFSDTEEDCEAMAKKLSIKSGCTEYDIYEVNIPYGTMSLYRDPADEANRSAW